MSPHQYSICGKTRGGQKCIFDVFLTKPVGVNKNLGVERHQRGVTPPPLQIENCTTCFVGLTKLLFSTSGDGGLNLFAEFRLLILYALVRSRLKTH